MISLKDELLFCEMYLAYKLEMNCIAKTVPDKFSSYIEDARWFIENIDGSEYHVDFVKLYAMIVGFVIWHETEDGCYIDEAYTSPFYRRYGLMRKTVKDLKDKYKHISLFILDENKAAKEVWEHIFGELEVIGEKELGHEYRTK